MLDEKLKWIVYEFLYECKVFTGTVSVRCTVVFVVVERLPFSTDDLEESITDLQSRVQVRKTLYMLEEVTLTQSENYGSRFYDVRSQSTT